jgi:hypothetical protein
LQDRGRNGERPDFSLLTDFIQTSFVAEGMCADVLLNDPAKGYGILIDHMLEASGMQ